MRSTIVSPAIFHSSFRANTFCVHFRWCHARALSFVWDMVRWFLLRICFNDYFARLLEKLWIRCFFFVRFLSGPRRTHARPSRTAFSQLMWLEILETGETETVCAFANITKLAKNIAWTLHAPESNTSSLISTWAESICQVCVKAQGKLFSYIARFFLRSHCPKTKMPHSSILWLPRCNHFVTSLDVFFSSFFLKLCSRISKHWHRPFDVAHFVLYFRIFFFSFVWLLFLVSAALSTCMRFISDCICL